MRVGFAPLFALLACGPSTGQPIDSSSDSGSTFALDTSTATAAEASSNDTLDASTGGATLSSSSSSDEGPTTSATEASSGAAEASASSEDGSSTGAPSESCDEALVCGDDCMQWESLLGGEPEVGTRFIGTEVAADGTILVAGQRDVTSESPGETFLRRYDVDGALLDEQLLLDQQGDVTHFPTNLAVAPDGRIAVIGRVYVDDSDRDAFVELRAADGTSIASDIVEEASGSVDVNAVAFDSDGVLFVGGSRVPLGGQTALLRGYDDELDLTWERSGAELGDARDVQVLAPVGDDELFAITDAWIGRIASDGTSVWSVGTDVFGVSTVIPLALTATSSGDALLVGASFSGGVLGGWAGRLDGTTGDLVWSVDYAPIADELVIPHGVVSDDDGRVFVRADHRFTDGTAPNQMVVQQLDCAGAVLWEWAHVSSAGYYHESSGGLAWSESLGLTLVGTETTSVIGTRAFITRLVPTP